MTEEDTRLVKRLRNAWPYARRRMDELLPLAAARIEALSAELAVLRAVLRASQPDIAEAGK